MLLEAYFMHIDNTWNRLQTLNEYIEDTEDLVNLKLDQHRNQLISLDLLLTAFTAACAVVNVVAGIFGMNLVSGLAEDAAAFSQVTYTAIGVSVLFYLCFVAFVWVKQLLTL